MYKLLSGAFLYVSLVGVSMACTLFAPRTVDVGVVSSNPAVAQSEIGDRLELALGTTIDRGGSVTVTVYFQVLVFGLPVNFERMFQKPCNKTFEEVGDDNAAATAAGASGGGGGSGGFYYVWSGSAWALFGPSGCVGNCGVVSVGQVRPR